MPDDDPLEQLKKLKAAQKDPLAELKATKPAKHDYHAEYASGALQKRMEGANARDMANAAENTDVVGPGKAFGHALGATMANAGEGIPGFEAAQAGIRSLASHLPNVSMQGGVPIVTPGSGAQSYREALGDIRGEVDKLPTALKVGERIAGAMPLTKFMPASPVAGGAMLGAADQALSADPDQSVGGRALRTAGGAVGGALVGKVGETLVTGGRAMFSKTAAANVLARTVKRAADAQRNYATALREGKGRLGTVAVKRFLAQPDIAATVSELQQTRPMEGVSADAPEMLDAVYKVLSDRAAQLKRGLEMPTPNRPNVGRFNAKDVDMAQTDLLDAVSGGASMPGPMPTYRTAVEDFAQQSNGIEGVRRGEDALREAMSTTIPSGKNLTRTTPEALQEWARAADDATKSAAGEGVLGGVKSAFKTGIRPGFRALRKAPAVMRGAGDPTQALVDYLISSGLIAGNAGRPR